MSAGAFVNGKYQDNKGRIYRVRVQPETLTAEFTGGTNSAVSGAVTQSNAAKARGGKRSYGTICRTIAVKPIGSPPAGYEDGQVLVIPVMAQAVYEDTEIGDTATYLGVTCLVTGKSPERVK